MLHGVMAMVVSGYFALQLPTGAAVIVGKGSATAIAATEIGYVVGMVFGTYDPVEMKAVQVEKDAVTGTGKAEMGAVGERA